jgi:CubicO group peptidase (beta-lactamase class C family)
LGCIVFGCYIGEPLPPDQKIWNYGHPDEFNLNADILTEVDRDTRTGRFQNIQSIYMIKNGHIVYENHYQNGSRHQPIRLENITLALTITAVGIAFDEGMIGSLDDPIMEYLPRYQSVFEEIPDLQDITIRHLLENRTGLAWNESIISYDAPNNNLNQMMRAGDRIEYYLRRPLEAVPGTRISYNGGSGLVLAAIVAHAVGNPMIEFLEERIFRPLEIIDYEWETDPLGFVNGSTGLSLLPLDFLKFSYLWLNEGSWQGKRLIPRNWILETTDLKVQVGTTQNYGYFWERFDPEFQSIADRSEDVYFIKNFTGDHLYVLPDQNMILFINAEQEMSYGFYNPSFLIFVNSIMAIN